MDELRGPEGDKPTQEYWGIFFLALLFMCVILSYEVMARVKNHRPATLPHTFHVAWVCTRVSIPVHLPSCVLRRFPYWIPGMISVTSMSCFTRYKKLTYYSKNWSPTAASLLRIDFQSTINQSHPTYYYTRLWLLPLSVQLLPFLTEHQIWSAPFKLSQRTQG